MGRPVLVQKMWVSEAYIDVEDDATIDDIVDLVGDVANEAPEWCGTTLMENDEEIWSV